MASGPRFRLRTIFLVFLCAAVGLALHHSALGALQPAIATAMVIGLVQQMRQLRSWRPAPQAEAGKFAFARRFAITWRAVVVLLLAASVVGELMISGRLYVLLYTYVESVSSILVVYLIVVLCNSLVRWRSASQANAARMGWAAFRWTIALAVALVTLVDGSVIVYLVHRSTAGIEANIPTPYQRPGVYPDLQAEGFWSVWISLAAALSVVAAGAACAWSFRGAKTASARRWAVGVAAVLLILPLGFCCWYHTTEFHRISPDLAGAGLDANWGDWLAGTILAIIIVTAGAYRLSRSHEHTATVSSDLAHDVDRTAFHESFVGLVALGIGSLSLLAQVVFAVFSMPTWLGSSPSAWNYVTMVSNPVMLLLVGQAIAGLQLCWLRWRRRSEAVPWELAAVPRGRFYRAWMGLAIILAIGVLTLSAFAFVFWLGPFNFLGL